MRRVPTPAGYVVQLPMPSEIDENVILGLIDPARCWWPSFDQPRLGHPGQARFFALLAAVKRDVRGVTPTAEHR